MRMKFHFFLLTLSLFALLGCGADVIDGGFEVTQPEAVSAETSFLPIVRHDKLPLTLPDSIELTKVADGYWNPVYLTHAGDSRLFVVERAGRIYIIENGAKLPTPFLDIRSKVNDSSSERGLLSMAFHPDYATNGRFYVYYTFGSDGDVMISSFNVSADPNVANAASESTVITIDQPYWNHNGGQLKFGPDGYLYVGLGDGGGQGDPEGQSQDWNTLLGSMLRLDVDCGLQSLCDAAEPYDIPPTNPYVDISTARDEGYYIGLRNPWRFSFDRENGDIYIADVGQGNWEELNWLEAGTTGGTNFGWNVFEGTSCFTDPCSNPDAYVMPVVEYDHSQGCSITGGYVYRGAVHVALKGIYLYADFCQGHIWAAANNDGQWQTQRVMQGAFNVSSFGEDVDGELYVLDYSGSVYKVVGAD